MSIIGTSSATLELKDIHVRRDDTSAIGRMSYKVEDDLHWVILGANGSGKTTLMRIMALYDHPTSGMVDVLGERLGQVDIRVLRERVG
jgi:iron complex transport system ATP-binding protein